MERRDPVKHFLEEVEHRAPDEAGGTPEHLVQGVVQRLAKYQASQNKDGEKAYEVFAATEVSAVDLKKEVARLNHEKMHSPETFYTGPGGKGGGKHGHTANRDKNWWCTRCAEYWKAQGANVSDKGPNSMAYKCRHQNSMCKFRGHFPSSSSGTPIVTPFKGGGNPGKASKGGDNGKGGGERKGGGKTSEDWKKWKADLKVKRADNGGGVRKDDRK